MQSVKYAFKFIGASFSLALKHPQLQEPWFTLSVGGLILLFIAFLPIGLVAGLIGLTPVGLVLIGLFSVLLLAGLLIWGEITALLTVRAFAEIGQEATPEGPSNLNLLKTHALDILSLALITPILKFGQALKGLFKPNAEPKDDRNRWLNAHTLALPVIAVESRPLQDTLARLRQIVKDNLLRFSEGLIRVRLVAVIVQILLLAAGVVLAFVVGLKLADPQTASPWQQVMAAGISMLVAWLPTLLGILFSSFVRACYATALYQWAQQVENARGTGNTQSAQPPAILRQVLGMGQIQKES